MVEQVGADGKAEAGGRLCRQIPAANSQHGAGQRTKEHLSADGQDIRRDAAGGFDERGEPGHVIRQLQVEIDLRHDENCAQKRHQRLALSHTLEKFDHGGLHLRSFGIFRADPFDIAFKGGHAAAEVR